MFLYVEIKNAVIEAVQELLPARPAQPALDLAKSWAKVAGGGRGLAATSTGDEPRRAVPAKHPRELIVKAPNKAPEMAGRTAQQIVDATNAAIGTKEAVAARRLRSGDVVLTFKEDPGETAKRDDWVQTAFGAGALVQRREYAVIVKGLPAIDLQSIQSRPFLQQIQAVNRVGIQRYKIKLPRNSTATYTTAILHIGSVEKA